MTLTLYWFYKSGLVYFYLSFSHSHFIFAGMGSALTSAGRQAGWLVGKQASKQAGKAMDENGHQTYRLSIFKLLSLLLSTHLSAALCPPLLLSPPPPPSVIHAYLRTLTFEGL